MAHNVKLKIGIFMPARGARARTPDFYPSARDGTPGLWASNGRKRAKAKGGREL